MAALEGSRDPVVQVFLLLLVFAGEQRSPREIGSPRTHTHTVLHGDDSASERETSDLLVSFLPPDVFEIAHL